MLLIMLVITLPDLAQFSTDPDAHWTLCEPSGAPLRSGNGPLSAAPREAQVIALVPAGRVVFIETLLPAVSVVRRDQLVRYAIEDKLTIDPATVHAVVLESLPKSAAASKASSATTRSRGAQPRDMQIVAAIDRVWFSAALSWLASAGFKPRAAFAETALLPVTNGEWSVKLTAKNAFAKRADGFAYAIDAGTSGQPPFALTLALNEVAHKPAAITVFLAAPTDRGAVSRTINTSTMSEDWRTSLGVPTRVVEFGNGGGMQGGSQSQEWSQSLKRLAALKSGNLLTGEFAPIRPANAWLGHLKPALALVGVITFIQITALVADNWQLERKRQAIENEMRVTFQAAFPRATAIIDPALQMQRNLDTLKRERGLLRDDDVRHVLAQFAALREALPELEVTEVSIKQGAAKLVARLDTAPASASDDTAALSALASVLKVRLASISGVSTTVNTKPGNKPGTVEIIMKASP